MSRAMQSDDDKTRAHTILSGGTMVGHYQIISKIGSGGMGEVYLALDTKLNRKVALKFLPSHLCEDEDCRKRFTREAQAAAGLDHPNIAAIYEVGEYQGRPFYSMQVVQGQSLGEVIAGKDLPIERILEIAIQICEGLDAAHAKGITHRDIKPSNILLDEQGRVRIVDFGLASVRGSEQLTKTGSTLGTIGYMSPEQVQGKEVDQRSDLFSLGVVLYEMITKQNPFKRDSEAATLKAVSDDLPHPAARYRSDLPEGFQTIVDKALDKNRDTRYQHADDLRADLLRIREKMSGQRAASTSGATRKSSRAVGYAAGTLGVIAIAIAIIVISLPRENQRSVQPAFKKITNVGSAYYGAISPDGKSYAYSTRSRGKLAVHVADFESDREITVFQGDYGQSICWSPNGRELLIRGSEEGDSDVPAVYLVSRLGGKYRKFHVPGSPDYFWDIAWYPDGSKFVSVADYNRMIYTDKVTGDTSVVPLSGAFSYVQLGNFSPDGKWLVLFGIVGDELGLWVVGSDGRNARKISDMLCAWPVWSAVGDAVYGIDASASSTGNRLIKLNMEPESGQMRGGPEVLLSGLPGTIGLSISSDGRKLLTRQVSRYGNIWRLDLTPGQEPTSHTGEQITSGTGDLSAPAISPDGKYLSYSVGLQSHTHVFVRPVSGGEATQITHGDASYFFSKWSPDGERIAVLGGDEQFDSSRVAVVDKDGSHYKTLFTIAGATGVSLAEWLDWSVSDKIVLEYEDRNGLLFVNPENGDTAFWSYDVLGDDIRCPLLSPDGSKLAVLRYQPEDNFGEVVVFTLADSTAKVLTRTGDDMTQLQSWSRDGQWVYYLTHDKVLARANMQSEQVDTLAIFPEVEMGFYGSTVAISPDETFAIYQAGHQQNDIYLIENFDPHVK